MTQPYWAVWSKGQTVRWCYNLTVPGGDITGWKKESEEQGVVVWRNIGEDRLNPFNFWWIYSTAPNGNSPKRSSGTTNLEEAKALALLYI